MDVDVNVNVEKTIELQTREQNIVTPKAKSRTELAVRASPVESMLA